MGYGQSLSLGIGGAPALTTIQPYSNVAFASGIRRELKGGGEYRGLTPLIETTEGARGETGIAAAGNVLTERAGLQILGSSAGRAGEAIRRLERGGADFRELSRMIRAGADNARAVGRPYSYLATVWTQGETDQARGSTRQVYAAELDRMVMDIDGEVRALGQSTRPFLVASQPASHLTYFGRKGSPWFPEVALALRSRAVAPLYFGDFKDGVHANNETYRMLGRYHGRALAKMVKGASLVSLDARSIALSGSTITVRFAVPKPPLVFDTEWVAEARHYGFDVWSPSLQRLDLIQSLNTVGDAVEIKLSGPPPAGAILSYGIGHPGDSATAGRRQGPRGNLRDSEGDGDFLIDAGGGKRRLDNWALLFADPIP